VRKHADSAGDTIAVRALEYKAGTYAPRRFYLTVDAGKYDLKAGL